MGRSQRILQTLQAGALLPLAIPADYIEVRRATGEFSLKTFDQEIYEGLRAGLAWSLPKVSNSITLKDLSGAPNTVELFLAVGVQWHNSGTIITETAPVSEASAGHGSYPALLLVSGVRASVLPADPGRRNALLRLPEDADAPVLIGDATVGITGPDMIGDVLMPGGTLPWPSQGEIWAWTVGDLCRVIRTAFTDTP